MLLQHHQLCLQICVNYRLSQNYIFILFQFKCLIMATSIQSVVCSRIKKFDYFQSKSKLISHNFQLLPLLIDINEAGIYLNMGATDFNPIRQTVSQRNDIFIPYHHRFENLKLVLSNSLHLFTRNFKKRLTRSSLNLVRSVYSLP